MKEIKINKKSFFVTGPDAPHVKNFWVNVNDNNWETDAYRIFDEFLDKEHSYIDIGAWVGPTVLYGAQLAKHTYAIEPDAIAFAALEENIDLNPHLKNKITLFNGCIANISGEVKLLTMTDFGDSMSSISFSNPKDYSIVKSLTLDEFIKSNNVKNCNFIKMDIEGGEALVLSDMKEYLRKNKSTLFLSLHPFWFKDKEKDVKAIIDALRVYSNLYYPDGRRLKERKLLKILLSLDSGNFSIIATDNWNLVRRLLHIFRIYKFKILKRLVRVNLSGDCPR